jgi:DNA-binding transcriptional LysR family regulator
MGDARQRFLRRRWPDQAFDQPGNRRIMHIDHLSLRRMPLNASFTKGSEKTFHHLLMTDHHQEARRKELPPLPALASFLAAIETSNFSQTGQRLALTQSAVSRQIALLEDWLQVKLFERKGRRVVPTAAALAYAEAIGPAVDRIRAATRRALQPPQDAALSIATLPSFGMRWLAPRLPDLSAHYPDMLVNLAARSSPFDFADEGFDAAIHFGLPDWPGAEHALLFREDVVAVCSPAWLAAHPLEQPADLVGKTLLSLDPGAIPVALVRGGRRPGQGAAGGAILRTLPDAVARRRRRAGRGAGAALPDRARAGKRRAGGAVRPRADGRGSLLPRLATRPAGQPDARPVPRMAAARGGGFLTSSLRTRTPW